MSADAQTPEHLDACYRQRLLLVAMRRLHDKTLAEDVVQETLARVSEALDNNRVRDRDALPGFVLQTARNVCRQMLRKAGRERRALSRLAAEPQRDAAENEPLTDLIGEERRGQVRRALSELDARDRNLLEWLYGQGLDIRDVALRIAATPGAVRVHKHRALKRLAAAMHRNEA